MSWFTGTASENEPTHDLSERRSGNIIALVYAVGELRRFSA